MNFFEKFKDRVRELFPYPPLEYFDRECADSVEIKVERELLGEDISEREFDLVVREFAMKLAREYVALIRQKAPCRAVSFEEFARETYPQKAYQADNVFFVPFNLPIAFQEFEVDEKAFSITAKVSLVDDLLEDNAMVKE
ncbi:MAG: hypothetical protein ACLFNB_03895 [Candidatus Woesearchaeota archaeon]